MTASRPFWLSASTDGTLAYHPEHPDSGPIHDTICVLLSGGDPIPTQPPPLEEETTPGGDARTVELLHPVTFSVEGTSQTLACPECDNDRSLLLAWFQTHPTDTATAVCACARRWTSLLVQAIVLYQHDSTPESP